VESGQNSASVLKDFFRSPGKISLLVDSIRTPSGVYLEYTWSPAGFLSNTQLLHSREVQVDSRWIPDGLQIQYQEFTWTPDGVHQDPWLSVTTSPRL